MFKFILISLIFASVGCTKNTTGSCLDGVMSQVSTDLQNNDFANLIVIKMCKENGNDYKKVSDLLANPKQ